MGRAWHQMMIFRMEKNRASVGVLSVASEAVIVSFETWKENNPLWNGQNNGWIKIMCESIVTVLGNVVDQQVCFCSKTFGGGWVLPVGLLRPLYISASVVLRLASSFRSLVFVYFRKYLSVCVCPCLQTTQFRLGFTPRA